MTKPQQIKKEDLSFDLRNQIERGGTVYGTNSIMPQQFDSRYLLRSANDFNTFEENEAINEDDIILTEEYDNFSKLKITAGALSSFVANRELDIYTGFEIKSSSFTAEFKKTYVMAGVSSRVEVTLPTDGFKNGNSFRLFNRSSQGFKILVPPTQKLFVGITEYNYSNPFEFYGAGSIGACIEIQMVEMPEQREWFTIADLNFSGFVSAPSSSSDFGLPGQIAYDDDYFYICVSFSRWKRTSLGNF